MIHGRDKRNRHVDRLAATSEIDFERDAEVGLDEVGRERADTDMTALDALTNLDDDDEFDFEITGLLDRL